MTTKQMIALLCALGCLLGLATPVSAAEIDSGDRYCFGVEDFTPGESALTGICIIQLPEATLGTVMLGQRQLRPGDVLTAEQIPEMTFLAAQGEEDVSASITYLPVFSNGLSGEATMTLSIHGRENKAPVAEDSAFETYKNLEVTGKLKVRDPEGQMLQFSVIRPPKRGDITIREDGSFTYSPRKNKVGVDSFTFTAADPAGKVSRETTVTVTIHKPSDAKQYSDTVGKDCRFAAEWMRTTGIFIGETIGGSPCFSPDKAVTRGEFTTMLVKALKLPTDPAVTQTGYSDVPNWLKPYLAAAIRSGLTAALPAKDSFNADDPITAEDAASLLCAALNLHLQEQPAISAENETADAVTIANENGFELNRDRCITRGDAAMLMYQAVRLMK